MRRLVNLRTMLTVAVSETAVILCAYTYYVWHTIGLALCIAYYILLVVGLLLAYLFAKNRQLAFALLLCLLCGGVTHTVMAVRYATYHTIVLNSKQSYVVQGTVDTVTAQDGMVQGVSVANVTVNGEKVSGKIQLLFDEDDVPERELPIGCRVRTSGILYARPLINGSAVDGTAYRKNIRYVLYTSYETVETTAQKAALPIRIRRRLHDRLVSACGDTYGSIAYCMLTGDKSELDSTTLRLYSVSGVGHILAVSGLHVGLLAAVVLFLLRKLRLPRILQVCFTLALLFVYAAFVGFTASVVRACIMSGIGLCTLVNGQRKDVLNSMSLAYAVILLWHPFLLFEVGFLLSFAAVFGIILFSRPFAAALRKIHLPRWLAASLGATAAVHVGILPVSAYFFGAVQTYSVLCNLLLVPLLSVTFAFFVLTVPIGMLFPVYAVFRVGAVGFALADIVMGFIAILPLSQIYINGHVGLFFLFPLYFVASRFFMLPAGKWILSLGCATLCAVLAIVPTLAALSPDKEVQNSLIPVNGYGDVTQIIIDERVTVIGDCKDMPALKATLQRHHIRKIDAVVLHALTEKIGKGLHELCKNFYVGKIICPLQETDSDGIAALGKYKNFYIWEESDHAKCEQVFTNNSRHGGFLYHYSNDIAVLAMRYSASYTNISVEIIDEAPIIRCFMYLNAYPDRIYITNMPKGYLGETAAYQYSLAENREFVFDLQGMLLQKNK